MEENRPRNFPLEEQRRLDYRTALAVPVGELALGVAPYEDTAVIIDLVRVVEPGHGVYTDDPEVRELAEYRAVDGTVAPLVSRPIWDAFLEGFIAGDFRDIGLPKIE